MCVMRGMILMLISFSLYLLHYIRICFTDDGHYQYSRATHSILFTTWAVIYTMQLLVIVKYFSLRPPSATRSSLSAAELKFDTFTAAQARSSISSRRVAASRQRFTLRYALSAFRFNNIHYRRQRGHGVTWFSVALRWALRYIGRELPPTGVSRQSFRLHAMATANYFRIDIDSFMARCRLSYAWWLSGGCRLRFDIDWRWGLLWAYRRFLLGSQPPPLVMRASLRQCSRLPGHSRASLS